MSASLSTKLQREIKKSPKKAGMLALLFVVAVYFWVPLVMGGPAAKPVVSPTAAAATSTPAPIAVAPVPAVPTTTWQQLVHWMEHDVRMKSMPVMSSKRDPLQPLAQEATEEPEQKIEVATILDIKPESLGLVLSSTIVGSERSVAQISDRTYRVGEHVPADKSSKQQFVIEQIGPRYVVLGRNGRSFTLRMTDPTQVSSAKLPTRAVEPADEDSESDE
jgi:hypothetical protein